MEDEYWAYVSTDISSYSHPGSGYRKNKEGDTLPQMNLLIVFGEKSGLPFYYRNLAGNILDVKTVKRLMENVIMGGIMESDTLSAKSNRMIIAEWLVYALFCCAMIVFHQNVFMYFDDFGYASLTYAVTVPGIEEGFTLIDVFKYLKLHYHEWGGRVLYFFFEIILLKNGPFLIRIVQPVVITGIIAAVNHLSGKEWRFGKAILLCSVYGLFEINVLQHGVYWFTASVLYVFPIFPLLLSIRLYGIYCDESLPQKQRVIYSVFMIIFAFLAAFSQEQIAVAMVSIVVLIFIYRMIFKHKVTVAEILMAIFAVLGALLEIAAPGNWKRLDQSLSSLSLFEKLTNNIGIIFDNIFGENMFLFSVAFMIAMVVLGYKNTIEAKKKGCRYLHAGFCIAQFSLLLINVVIYAINNLTFYVYINGAVSKIIVMCYVICVLVEIIVYLINGRIFLIFLTVGGAIASIAVITVSPVIPGRTFLPFMFLMMPLMASAINGISYKGLRWFLVIAICILGLQNTSQIYMGYLENAETLRVHHNQLSALSESIKVGGDEMSIQLEKTPNSLYRGAMPYDEGYEWSDVLVKNYYHLPDDIVISFIPPTTAKKVYIASVYPEVIDIHQYDIDNNVQIAIGIVPSAIEKPMKILLNGVDSPIFYGDNYISSFFLAGDIVFEKEIKVEIVDQYGTVSDGVKLDIHFMKD